jgi:hypothetical protein
MNYAGISLTENPWGFSVIKKGGVLAARRLFYSTKHHAMLSRELD